MATVEHTQRQYSNRFEKVEAEIGELRRALDLDRAAAPAPKAVDSSFNRRVDPTVSVVRSKLAIAQFRAESALDEWLARWNIDSSDYSFKGDPTGTSVTLQMLGAPAHAVRKVQQFLGNARLLNNEFRRFQGKGATNETVEIFVGADTDPSMVKSTANLAAEGIDRASVEQRVLE
ncbi:unnamed protein product, partial [Prorocentrum cordatum]